MEKRHSVFVLPLDLAPRPGSGHPELSLCPSGRRPLEMVSVVVAVSGKEVEEEKPEWARQGRLYSSRAAAKALSSRWAHWSLLKAAAGAAVGAAAADFAAAAAAAAWNSSFGDWLERVV